MSEVTNENTISAAPAAATAGKVNRGTRWAIHGVWAPMITRIAIGKPNRRIRPAARRPRVLDCRMAANDQVERPPSGEAARAANNEAVGRSIRGLGIMRTPRAAPGPSVLTRDSAAQPRTRTPKIRRSCLCPGDAPLRHPQQRQIPAIDPPSLRYLRTQRRGSEVGIQRARTNQNP